MTCRHCPGLTQVTRSVTRAAGLSPASGVSGPPSPQLPRGAAIVARVSQSAGPAPRHFCGLSCWTPLGNCAPVGSSQPPAAQPPRDADGRLPAVPSAHAPSQPRGAVSSAWHTCKAAAAETGQRDSVPQSSMGGRRGPKLRLWGQWRSSPSLSRANRKHFRCVRGVVSVPQSDQPRLSSRCPPGRVGVGKHPMVASKRLPGAAGQDPSALVNLRAESCPGQPGAFRAVCSPTRRLRHLHVPSCPMAPALGCRLQPSPPASVALYV